MPWERSGPPCIQLKCNQNENARAKSLVALKYDTSMSCFLAEDSLRSCACVPLGLLTAMEGGRRHWLQYYWRKTFERSRNLRLSAKCILSLLYREVPVRDVTRPPRKLPDPVHMVPRPGTAAAALQKRRLRNSKDWRAGATCGSAFPNGSCLRCDFIMYTVAPVCYHDSVRRDSRIFW